MPRQKKCRHRADGEECLLTFPFIGLFRLARLPGLLASYSIDSPICSYFTEHRLPAIEHTGYTLPDDSSSEAARLLGLRAFRVGNDRRTALLVLVGSE